MRVGRPLTQTGYGAEGGQVLICQPSPPENRRVNPPGPPKRVRGGFQLRAVRVG